jgi:hypothetical protein
VSSTSFIHDLEGTAREDIEYQVGNGLPVAGLGVLFEGDAAAGDAAECIEQQAGTYVILV